MHSYLPSHAETGPAPPQEGLQVAHRGLGPDSPDSETVYHNYYMWVPYVLFLQALCFYIPHWLWKMMQTDKVQNVLQVSRYSCRADGFVVVDGAACRFVVSKGT